MNLNLRLNWIVLVLLAMGCAEERGGGKTVPTAKSPSQPSATLSDTENLTPPPPIMSEVPVPATASSEPIAIKVKYREGSKFDYSLTNGIEISLPGSKEGEVVRQDTFLNAMQNIAVGATKGGLTNVTIKTNKVAAGFAKPTPENEEAGEFLKKTAAGIEGSVLTGQFDASGRGTKLELEGEGVGLNPLGPQVGSQDVMVGLMGILLPERLVNVGDEWSAKFDFQQSASDLFGQAGAKTENSEVTLVYKLLDYNKEKNLARFSVVGKGKPTIKLPTEGSVLEVQVSVDSKGQATVRLDDGWLQELRLETTVVMEGFISNKQIVKTVTKRLN